MRRGDLFLYNRALDEINDEDLKQFFLSEGLPKTSAAYLVRLINETNTAVRRKDKDFSEEEELEKTGFMLYQTLRYPQNDIISSRLH